MATKQPLSDESLTRFKDALQIVRTGRDSVGRTYIIEGILNQAAWIGENSGVLIAEIRRLRQDIERINRYRARTASKLRQRNDQLNEALAQLSILKGRNI